MGRKNRPSDCQGQDQSAQQRTQQQPPLGGQAQNEQQVDQQQRLQSSLQQEPRGQGQNPQGQSRGSQQPPQTHQPHYQGQHMQREQDSQQQTSSRPRQQRGRGGQQQQPQSQQQQGAWRGQDTQQQRGQGPQHQRGRGTQSQSYQQNQGGETWSGQDRRRSGQQQHPQAQQQQQAWRGQGDQQQRGQRPQQQRGRGTQSWGSKSQSQQQNQGGQGSDSQDQQQRRQQSGQRYRGGPPQPHTVDRSFQQLAVSNEKLLPAKEKSCAGIERGTLGTPGSLEVNYLNLSLDKMKDKAYHYDVTITPDRPKKFLRPAFAQCQRELFESIVAAFDGNKSCYTNERLPVPIEHNVEVIDFGGGNRTKSFKIEIKETSDCVVDMNTLRTYHNERVFDKPMRAIQVLDVVLSANNYERGIRAGRQYFCRANEPYDLEQGYEALTGLFQAALLGEVPLFNVDIVHKSFPRQSTLLEFLETRRINPNKSLYGKLLEDVQRFLKGLDIVYEPPVNFGSSPKKYRVLDVGEPSTNLRFKLEDGRQTTVAAYYADKGYQLRYPYLNCVKVGSSIRSIHLPMELCSIVEGQALNRKDGKIQVKNMIKFAATSTNTRKLKLMNILRYFQHNESAIIRGFGIQIGSDFIKVPSRILPAPSMEYLNGQIVTARNGVWSMEDKQFLITKRPAKGHKWVILYEPKQKSEDNLSICHEMQKFKKIVLSTSERLNMNLAAEAKIMPYNDRKHLESTLENLSQDGTALVFVVLAYDGKRYDEIKQSAELKVGILTQCIKENTLLRKSADLSTISNILLKVNVKLNGTNHKIASDIDPKLMELMRPLKRVMFLGADVTHPSPDQRHIPSVVGVVASHDTFGACYNPQYRLQESNTEHIVDMEAIVSHHLKIFHQFQNNYPEQIIYYRDGVSDGQFPKITSVELGAIRKACAKLNIDVKLTCIIVVKRHHTRFFPMTQPKHFKDNNNVEPGTVVDQHITHPNEVQFFMVSHQSIQGTARPTRYNVIVDDSKFDINFLQKLTYNMCHLFPRCNRSVSYPAPAYLAHLVAFRGRVYLEGPKSYSRNLQSEYEKRLIRPEFMASNPMYFV